jgi:hypothetical protein
VAKVAEHVPKRPGDTAENALRGQLGLYRVQRERGTQEPDKDDGMRAHGRGSMGQLLREQ